MSWPIAGLLLVTAFAAVAQPSFRSIQVLTNKEVLLRITSTNTYNYRIDVSSNLMFFDPLLTFRSTGISHHIDTAAPYYNSRFYRAAHLTNTGVITGDHLVTTNGVLTIQPVHHAGFLMSWNGSIIYNDPAGAVSRYAGFPKADLILLSHNHSDHLDTNVLHTLTNTTTRIIAPQGTYNAIASPTLKSMTTILGYGASTTVLGITVQAVRAVNGNHPEGVNNAYVTTIGGKRILTTGDCGSGPELLALQNIDAAFVCMNSFTMTATAAAGLVRGFRPKVVFPYHFGSVNGSASSDPLYDTQAFKGFVGQDLGIEVRLRKWY